MLELDNLYHYKAKVGRVIDGDTFTLDEIDLGFGVVLESNHITEWKVRLLGINCKELKSKDLEEKKLAFEAKDFVVDLLPQGTEVVVQSTGFDAFGRILANVWTMDGEYLNKTLLDKGLAVEYMVK